MTGDPTEAAEAVTDYEARRHTFDQEAIARMVKEHREVVAELPQIRRDLAMMVDDLYGTRRPTPADPDRRVGGRFANGGIRVKLPAWLAAVIVALAAGVATIAAAIIAAVWGG